MAFLCMIGRGHPLAFSFNLGLAMLFLGFLHMNVGFSLSNSMINSINLTEEKLSYFFCIDETFHSYRFYFLKIPCRQEKRKIEIVICPIKKL